jgi:rhodanese-related sulfurtransferase
MFYALLSTLLTTAPLTTEPLAATFEAPTPIAQKNHRMVTSKQLKSWYDQNKQMVVIDARSDKYFDGRMLPNAKRLTSESSEKEISNTIPNKNTLIVVYCYGVKCPASGWLYDKLQTMGYRNIYEYHEGIEVWAEKGYPITK